MKHQLIKISFLAAIFTFWGTAGFTHYCERVLNFQLTFAPLEKSIVTERLAQVVAHQNGLLREAGDTELTLPAEIKPAAHHAHSNLLRVSIPYETNTLANFLFFGNYVVRAGWRHPDQFNYVYVFNRSKLLRAEPLSEFILSQSVEGDKISLTRHMRAEEVSFWKSQNIYALKHHSKEWDDTQTFALFGLKRVPWIDNTIPVGGWSWSIPRDVALRWAKDGLLSMGIVSIDKDLQDGTVVPAIQVRIHESAWAELAAFHNALKSAEEGKIKKTSRNLKSLIARAKSKFPSIKRD